MQTHMSENNESYDDCTMYDDALNSTPYLICQKYSKRKITREECRDSLIEWEYSPQDTTDGIDTLIIDVPGSWCDVEKAYLNGLIERSLYDEVLNALCDK